MPKTVPKTYTHPTLSDRSIEIVANFNNKKLMKYYHSCDRYLNKENTEGFREDITKAIDLLDEIQDTIGYMENKAKKTSGRFIKESKKVGNVDEEY